MQAQTFQLKCMNREIAEEIIFEIEKMGLVAEPYGEKSKKRKTNKIETVALIVNLPVEKISEPDILVMRKELEKIIQQKEGVSLLF